MQDPFFISNFTPEGVVYASGTNHTLQTVRKELYGKFRYFTQNNDFSEDIGRIR
jgi:hypothetical protein